MQKVPFAACGMPCGLCPMHHIQGDSRCPGCGVGEDSYGAGCKIRKCCSARGLASCGLCAEYPCGEIEGMTEFPGFNTGKVWLRVNADIKAQGVEGWYPAYARRCTLLAEAVEKYNDGRMKNYLCRLFMAAPLTDLEALMAEAAGIEAADAKAAGRAFKQAAARRLGADKNGNLPATN